MMNSHSNSSLSGSNSTSAAPIAQFQSPRAQIVDVRSKSHDIGLISGRFPSQLGFGTVVGFDIEKKTVVDLVSPALGSIGGRLHPGAPFISSSLPSKHKYMAVLSDLERFPGVSFKIVDGVESHVVTAQAGHFSAPIASVQNGNSGYTAAEDAIPAEEWDYSAFLTHAIACQQLQISTDLAIHLSVGYMNVARLHSVTIVQAVGNTTAVTEACLFKLGDQRLGWKGGTVPLVFCSTVSLLKPCTIIIVGFFRRIFQLLINPSLSWVVHGQGRPPENALGEASAWLSSQLSVPSLEGKTVLTGGVMIGIMF